jgi:hypothetical protein
MLRQEPIFPPGPRHLGWTLLAGTILAAPTAELPTAPHRAGNLTSSS